MLEKEFNQINESINKIKADNERRAEEIDAKLALTVSKAEQVGEEKLKEIKGEIAEQAQKYQDELKDVQKSFDDALIEFNKRKELEIPKTFGTELKKALDTEESFQRFKSGQSNMATLELKAALTTPLNASGEVVPRDIIPGIKMDPTRTVRVRDFIPTVPVSGNTYQFIQETSYTNNADTRVEASAYGESEFKLDAVNSPVRSIGSTIDLTKEMLEDVPAITGYIQMRLPAKVANVEDTQLLFGAGTGADLQGIMTSGGGTAFDETSTGAFFDFFAAADVSGEVNEYDVLVAAKNQATLVEYTPNVILVNPTDWNKMSIRKDANANYVVFQNGILTVHGIPVISSTAVTEDLFLVADLRQACSIGQRAGMEVSFSYENEDNFKKERVTVKGSERIALAIHNPNACVWGDFSDAFTALR